MVSDGKGKSSGLSARAQRVLNDLAQEGAFARWDGMAQPPLWRVVAQQRGVSLARSAFAKALGDDLVSAGSLCVQRARGSGLRLTITAAGRAALARAKAPPPGIDPFQVQHAPFHESVIDTGSGVQSVTLNSAESPMLWLHRRRGADGQPLLCVAQFAAGERFRADLTYAGALPQVTANWSSLTRNSGAAALPPTFSEARLAARQRLDRAIAELDAEMTGVMIDICGFLKGLGQIEHERCWPRRSARVVLLRALTILSRHYGLTAESGNVHPVPRHWGAANYRPLLHPPG